MMIKFKLLTGLFLAACLFSASLLAQTFTWSHGTFKNVGLYGQVKGSSIIIDDSVFLLSPTAGYSTAGNSNASLSLLEVGELVGFNFVIINNRLIVDHIWLIPENERKLYRPQP